MAPESQPRIAVVGLAFRFPGGATDDEKLWKCLTTGRSTWTPVPGNRYNENAFYHPDPNQRNSQNHRGGHFLEQDPAAFDAQFFGITPVEARSIDPQ